MIQTSANVIVNQRNWACMTVLYCCVINYVWWHCILYSLDELLCLISILILNGNNVEMNVVCAICCSIDKVPKVTSPVLVIHGTEDEVIDFSHGLAIYERCPRAVEPLWVDVCIKQMSSFLLLAWKNYSYKIIRYWNRYVQPAGPYGCPDGCKIKMELLFIFLK